MKKRILSGMRPTGKLHLGHYWGVLVKWAALQDEFDCYFMVADWHALTSEWKNSGAIHGNIRENVANWIAAGVDPEKSTIFVQSAVPQHAELHLILSCVTPLGWLERVPTYKEAQQELSSKGVDNYAFLGYPVLQAADILLYKGDVVPVGEDQLPHLELTREIVRRFHSTFAPDIFPEPTAKLTPTSRLMGLDGRRMSKSYGNTIDLGEDLESVEKKAKSMFTDPNRKRRADPGDPSICNVWTYHGQVNTPERKDKIGEDCRSAQIGCVECKAELATKLLEWQGEFQERRKKLLGDPQKLDSIIRAGNERALKVAARTMKEVREAVFNKK